jgi:hypothetical protein
MSDTNSHLFTVKLFLAPNVKAPPTAPAKSKKKVAAPVIPTRNKSITLEVLKLTRWELLKAITGWYIVEYQLWQSKEFSFTYQIIITDKVPKYILLSLSLTFLPLTLL